MDDLISRQAAIEAIACAIWHYPNLSFLSDYDHAHELAEDALKRLPPAKPERKTGKWIKVGQSFVYPDKFRNYMCSECGCDIEKTKYNYCPWCGAKMEVDE